MAVGEEFEVGSGGLMLREIDLPDEAGKADFCLRLQFHVSSWVRVPCALKRPPPFPSLTFAGHDSQHNNLPPNHPPPTLARQSTTMDKQLDALFGRVEAALTTLIDSIAKYNPSDKLADDLAHADRALAQGLRELEQHQANHARIQQLRAETAALDAKTKEIAGSLWAMRKEVDNTPTTTYPAGGARYPFTIEDLLGFARRISRNTLPPPGVTNGLDLSAPPTQQSEGMDGTATPGASFNSGVGTPGGGATAAATPDAMVSQATVASSVPEMPMDLRHAVNPGEGAVFIPWPTEDKIRSGALAEYQRLVERGMDPKGYDPEEEEQRKRDEEQAKKEAEERARLEHEEAERRMQEERARMARERERARQEAERRGSVAEPVGQKKSQFSFIDMDDEDDDE